MKRGLFVLIVILLVLPAAAFGRDVDAVVSCDWLEANLSNPRLVIVDIRKPEEYRAGHIPGAVNLISTALAIEAGGLKNELPPADELSEIIGDSGISANSIVVVVGPDFTAQFAFITRIAWTFVYAGVPNVAILDGGHAVWVKKNKPVATNVVTPKSVAFTAAVMPEYYASRDYVVSQMGKAALLDARSSDIYFGVKKQAFVSRFGHIAKAKNLPAMFAVSADGVLLPTADLDAMAKSLFPNKNAEIIAYCDSGVLATGWWWILHEMLGYKTVRNYDGSSQDAAADTRITYVKYIWE